MSKKRSGTGMYYERNKKKSLANLGTGLAVIFFVLLIAPYWLLDNKETYTYVKDAAVIRANVMRAEEDDGTYRLRIQPAKEQSTADLENFILSSSDLWIEVDQPTYLEYHLADSNEKVIGALVSEEDIYSKVGLFSNKKQLDRTIWEVTDIYDTYEEALQKNPIKQYEENAVVTKTHVTKKGDYFFILEQAGRSFTTQVSKEQFSKKKEGDSIRCEFKSIGQMVKLEKVLFE